MVQELQFLIRSKEAEALRNKNENRIPGAQFSIGSHGR